ncbi:hypothetical protein ACJX0J_039822, partial [Zea mays]
LDPTSYTLNKNEKDNVFDCLSSIKEKKLSLELCNQCLHFFMHIFSSIGVPLSHNEGGLAGKGTLERIAIWNVEHFSFNKAHFMILQQSSMESFFDLDIARVQDKWVYILHNYSGIRRDIV